ncbi:hypothetical protein [Sphingomonas aurantiaca]|jgi:hypothetical protein|uniref:Uncharacterized protein n=1 Tax=Sphingomonas aurantiaca TaxID=185949 RepID=A0A2T5GNF3_9SPHN|nr:hypothetical protein [Sphingomonas aurantiaca]PTQ60864.1 hypothetical protein C8J26_1179 [Sphingomonas aurantiaca]
MSHKTNRQIFAVPILLGVSTVAGLGAGLVGDGVWDVGAGLLLALPLVVTARCWVLPPATQPRRAESPRAAQVARRA